MQKKKIELSLSQACKAAVAMLHQAQARVVVLRGCDQRGIRMTFACGQAVEVVVSDDHLVRSLKLVLRGLRQPTLAALEALSPNCHIELPDGQLAEVVLEPNFPLMLWGEPLGTDELRRVLSPLLAADIEADGETDHWFRIADVVQPKHDRRVNAA